MAGKTDSSAVWDNRAPGWLRRARRVDSPNFDSRPAGALVDLLVIHHISLPPGYFSGDAIENLFCNTLDCSSDPAYAALDGLRVSSHFLVTRHGGVRQFVDIYERAWHAGVSSFQGRSACNDFSVGVELQGDSKRPFTPAQYRSLGLLTAALRQVLPLRFVAGHSDIAPGRKFDPGPRFDWGKFLATPPVRGLSRPLQ
ncbi:MAG: 1,6-anhydro-N-acetylmuramyl-L-alanine amidase AmpD [Burkholderiaceae bacterium]